MRLNEQQERVVLVADEFDLVVEHAEMAGQLIERDDLVGELQLSCGRMSGCRRRRSPLKDLDGQRPPLPYRRQSGSRGFNVLSGVNSLRGAKNAMRANS